MATWHQHSEDNMRTLFLCALLAPLILPSCHEWKVVPIEEIDPLSRQEFVAEGTTINVTVYTRGTFFITVTNTRRGYRLKEIPEVSSPSGNVFIPTKKGGNRISFNYSPESPSKVNDTPTDITITWTLEETNDDGFLILRRNILFDIAHSSGDYLITSIKISPVPDQPTRTALYTPGPD
jgi:hypothetical protein